MKNSTASRVCAIMATLQCIPESTLRPQCCCNARLRSPATRKLHRRSAYTASHSRRCSSQAVRTVLAHCQVQHARLQKTSCPPSDVCKRLATPSVSMLLTALATPLPSIADEATKADDAALESAQQYATVTFGGSFGQWDPVIAVFFYLVVGSLTVLTLGVSHTIQQAASLLAANTSLMSTAQVLYLSIRNWQDSTDEKKDRAQFSKSSQDRCWRLL